MSEYFDFGLASEEIAAIDALNSNERGGSNPEVTDLEGMRRCVAAAQKAA